MLNMKKLLLVCLLGLATTSCKKIYEETETSVKLKSATVNSPGLSQKVVFTYNQKGELENAKKYVNNVLETYLEYKYESGVLTSGKSYIKRSGSDGYDLVANLTLFYKGKNLTELAIFPVKPGAPSSPTKYVFEYGSGDVPVKFNLVLNNGSVIDYGYAEILSFPFEPGSDYRDRWTAGGNTEIPSFQIAYTYEFDTKNNPLYKLPWIDVVVDNGQISYIFSAPAYFGKNNATKISMSMIGTPLFSYVSTFTYLGNNYPSKRSIVQSPGSFTSETTYEY